MHHEPFDKRTDEVGISQTFLWTGSFLDDAPLGSVLEQLLFIFTMYPLSVEFNTISGLVHILLAADLTPLTASTNQV